MIRADTRALISTLVSGSTTPGAETVSVIAPVFTVSTQTVVACSAGRLPIALADELQPRRPPGPPSTTTIPTTHSNASQHTDSLRQDQADSTRQQRHVCSR